MFRALSLICLIWGFNFVAMKVAADFFTPELFVTYRFGLGAAVLLAFTYFTKQPLPPKKFWGWIVLTGAFQIAIGAAIPNIFASRSLSQMSKEKQEKLLRIQRK